MRVTRWQDKDRDDDPVVCSIKRAKELLKQFGGFAWTEHIDRDGGCFQTTDIQLVGNNSTHKYNHHL
jgi:hypothetical protein